MKNFSLHKKTLKPLNVIKVALVSYTVIFSTVLIFGVITTSDETDETVFAGSCNSACQLDSTGEYCTLCNDGHCEGDDDKWLASYQACSGCPVPACGSSVSDDNDDDDDNCGQEGQTPVDGKCCGGLDKCLDGICRSTCDETDQCQATWCATWECPNGDTNGDGACTLADEGGFNSTGAVSGTGCYIANCGQTDYYSDPFGVYGGNWCNATFTDNWPDCGDGDDGGSSDDDDNDDNGGNSITCYRCTDEVDDGNACDKKTFERTF